MLTGRHGERHDVSLQAMWGTLVFHGAATRFAIISLQTMWGMVFHGAAMIPPWAATGNIVAMFWQCHENVTR